MYFQFSSIGHVAHSLFGMLDSETEEFYNQTITQLERKHLESLQFIRAQRPLFGQHWNPLITPDIMCRIMKRPWQELQQILRRINVQNKNTEHKYARTALVMTWNAHTTRTRQAIGEVKRCIWHNNSSVLTWKERDYATTVVITDLPYGDRELGQDNFPGDLEIPVVLTEAYTYVLHIVSVDVALVEHNFVYTVQVPLVMHSVWSIPNNTILRNVTLTKPHTHTTFTHFILTVRKDNPAYLI